MSPNDEKEFFKAIAKSLHAVLPAYPVTRGAAVRVFDPKIAMLTPGQRVFAHTVSVKGDLDARIDCQIDHELGVRLTEQLGGYGPLRQESPECDEAMAELVNIVAGRALGMLAAKGLKLESCPPRRFKTALRGNAALLVSTSLGDMTFSVS